MSLSSGSSSSGHSYKGGGGMNGIPKVGYFAHHDYPQDDVGGGNENDFRNRYGAIREGGSRVGAISTENGAINLHIPCAFSYAYDVPVPPQNSKKSSESAKGKKSNKDVQHMFQKYPIRKPNSSTVPKQKEQGPFYTSVKSGQLYKAKDVHINSKTHNKTSVVWDFKTGGVPYQAVDYGRELYEQAAQNLAKSLHQQKLEESKSKLDEVEDNCRDYSKPAINSSKKTALALEKAMESLKKLPVEVEELLRKDKRFEPVVMSKATRALNVPRNTKVYKDLIPVDAHPDVQTEAENMIQAEIKRSIEATRQPSRTKDPEPNLQEIQTNSYTRIRPSPVPTPSKPSSGISLDVSHEFDAIENEKQWKDDSNRL
ncbi:hypothetical protein Ocin01_04165 [Orchesella cincta]|uniref:Protein phosphatase 1 regulatory subunit 35 C-terminal domain-containing protein n=1 Tax=Orchesella cincta TaxID=48709 RepID=A0A1D2NB78_ORCCI|nr:hypothetical protein Ocin01_04165 [Orchesella cincta]